MVIFLKKTNRLLIDSQISAHRCLCNLPALLIRIIRTVPVIRPFFICKRKSMLPSGENVQGVSYAMFLKCLRVAIAVAHRNAGIRRRVPEKRRRYILCDLRLQRGILKLIRYGDASGHGIGPGGCLFHFPFQKSFLSVDPQKSFDRPVMCIRRRDDRVAENRNVRSCGKHGQLRIFFRRIFMVDRKGSSKMTAG